MSRRHAFIAAVAALLVSTASPVAAQRSFSVGPLGGFNVDNEEFFLGVDFWFPLEFEVAGAPVVLRPEFTLYPFVGTETPLGNVDGSLITVSADLLFPFETDRDVQPFAFIGLGVRRSSVETNIAMIQSTSDTDLFLHLGAGAQFSQPNESGPFGMIGLGIANSTDFYLGGGYRFVP